SMALVALILFTGGLASLFVWRSRTAPPAVLDAIALGLCGPMIPLTFLGVVFGALAWQQLGASDLRSAAVSCALAGVCGIDVGFSLSVQGWSRRSFLVSRGIFLAALA